MNPLSRGRTLLLVAALSIVACASAPAVDPRELASADDAIQEAKQLGSERHARDTLREAEQRLTLAQVWMDAGRAEDASRALAEARVLADRAAAESLAAQAVRAAEAVRQSLSSLETTFEVELPDAD